jgi:hypothetical protein
MALLITDDTMVLEIDNRVVAAARFSEARVATYVYGANRPDHGVHS